MNSLRLTVGVISDTDGLLRPEAVAALRGSDLIVHAGDVGSEEILEELRAVAPTYAVRGNVDRGAGAASLPLTAVVEAGPHQLYVLHILEDLDLVPEAAGFSAVISGHSHRPHAQTRAVECCTSTRARPARGGSGCRRWFARM